MSNFEVFSNIASIVERDSKATTYKYALLRGVIDIVQENSPYVHLECDRAVFPMGLLVYKYILYYYPIHEAEFEIPQIGGSSNLAISTAMNAFIAHYKQMGGLSAFDRDLRGRGLSVEAIPSFIRLARKTSEVIRKMPMKHIGYSITGKHYSVFIPLDNGSIRSDSKHFDLKLMVDSMGSFSIPKEYYEAFKFLGSFISGRDSILFKWAEFSVNTSGKSLPLEKALSGMLLEPIDRREVLRVSEFYKKLIDSKGAIDCVWTGASMVSNYHVDHVIPYAAWSNNDLWNLLPAKGAVNGQKKDRIPTPGLIEDRKDFIIAYWEGLYTEFTERFTRELQVSLIGNRTLDNWQSNAINQLKESCRYLITQRGFQEWRG